MSDSQPDSLQLLSREEAANLLRPHVDLFDSCFRLAWADWEKLKPKTRSTLSARARASIIYDFAASHAKRLFEAREGVSLHEKRGFLTIHIGEKAEVRLKKLGRNRKSSNIQTKFQRDYGMQYPLFANEMNPTRLTAGYQLDLLQTGIENVLITCQKGKDLLWFMTVEEQSTGLIHRFEVEATEEQPTPKVRAKNVKKASDQ